MQKNDVPFWLIWPGMCVVNKYFCKEYINALMRYLSPNMNSPSAIIIKVFLFTAFYLQIEHILGTFNPHLFTRTISYVVGSVRICQRMDYHICDNRLLLLVLPVPTTGSSRSAPGASWWSWEWLAACLCSTCQHPSKTDMHGNALPVDITDTRHTLLVLRPVSKICQKIWAGPPSPLIGTKSKRTAVFRRETVPYW